VSSSPMPAMSMSSRLDPGASNIDCRYLLLKRRSVSSVQERTQ